MQEQALRKKRLHEKYAKMAKDFEKDAWMYPTVEEIMKGNISRTSNSKPKY